MSGCLDVINRKYYIFYVDIALLRETHVMKQDINRIENSNYSVASFLSANYKSEGVIVILHTGLKFYTFDKCCDQEGIIAYLTGVFGIRKRAVVNVHAPNSHEPFL